MLGAHAPERPGEPREAGHAPPPSPSPAPGRLEIPFSKLSIQSNSTRKSPGQQCRVPRALLLSASHVPAHRHSGHCGHGSRRPGFESWCCHGQLGSLEQNSEPVSCSVRGGGGDTSHPRGLRMSSAAVTFFRLNWTPAQRPLSLPPPGSTNGSQRG